MIYDKLKSKLEKVSSLAGELTSGFVESEISTKRMAICSTCENLSKNFGTCKLCGCVVSMKTKLVKSSCPIKKW